MKEKILFLIPTLMHGGAEKVLVNLVNYLDEDKYDITLQSIFNVGVNRQFLKKSIRYKYNFQHIVRGFTQIMKIFSPHILYKFLINEQYDIIVSFLEGPTARIVAGCPYTTTKKFAWIHIEQQSKKVFSRSFRNYNEAIHVYNGFDKIVCVSKTVKKDFDNLSGLKDKSIVLYNVNDTNYIIEKSNDNINDYTFDREVPIFCSVAKITKTKGFERLAHVHKRLLDEGLKHKIIVIGKGEDEKKIESFCKQNNISQSFQMIGFKENPYKYIAKCDGYICSSYREGFSTAVTEALILGIPCLSTNCSGAYELLGYNNEYGIVVDNSEEALYNGLKEILLSPNLLEYYKKMANIRGGQFSTTVTVGEVQKLFEGVF